MSDFIAQLVEGLTGDEARIVVADFLTAVHRFEEHERVEDFGRDLERVCDTARRFAGVAEVTGG